MIHSRGAQGVGNIKSLSQRAAESGLYTYLWALWAVPKASLT